MSAGEPFGRTEQDPIVQRGFRRQVWLEIYLPLLLVLAGGITALALNWGELVVASSSLADIMIAMLLLPSLIVLLPVIVLVAAAVYGIGLGIEWIPGPATKVQARAAIIAGEARRVSRAVARPVAAVEGLGAGWAALLRWTRIGIGDSVGRRGR